MTKKCVIAFGTRPEAIKLLSLMVALKQDHAHFSTHLCFTGQHPDLVQDILSEFDLQIDTHLTCSNHDGQLHTLGSQLLLHFGNFLSSNSFDLLIVQGDTSTSYMTALAAFYQHIPIAHIEAGLRSGDLAAPWPEEGHRKSLASLCHSHFAATKLAQNNLLREGIDPSMIWITGNTVVDALHLALDTLDKAPHLIDHLYTELSHSGLPNIEQTPFLLVTCHRRENWGKNLDSLLAAIRQILSLYPRHYIIWPLHPNPHLQTRIKHQLGGLSRVLLIPAQSYLSFVYLMRHAVLIISDSGGIQEEAPTLKTPVLLLRTNTERPECLESHLVTLVGSDTAKLVSSVKDVLESPRDFSTIVNPFGDGQAYKRLLKTLYILYD
ncbi:MAG: UDP-N-acetylglucosamine 2-epimerase (non-hydrolyzing) [bacterium]